MFRLFGIALLLIARNCVADTIVISSGFYDQVNVVDGRELQMTGGTIGYLNAVGGLSEIHGGTIESSRITNGARIVMDGTSQNGKSSTIVFNAEAGGSDIEIHGYQFRMYTWGQGTRFSSHNVEAYLLDGTFAFFQLNRTGVQSKHHFELVKHEPTLFQDPTRDWDFSLEDLNLIRNNFGESNTSIDTNFDGMIDLADLNLVRNHFGDFYYTPDMEFSGVIPPFDPSTPVPEPPAWVWVPASLLLLYLFRPRKELE